MTLLDRIEQAIATAFGPSAEAIPAPEWGGCLSAAARAVLQELQNPSDATAEAGAKAAWENVIDADEHALRIIFAAMIDAALVDGA